MLKAAQIEQLKKLGFDVDKLADAFKSSAEVEITIPEFNLFDESNPKVGERDANMMEQGRKSGFDEGKKAGMEIAGKELNRNLNLGLTETKDLTKVLEAVKTNFSKGDAGLQEQIALLQKDKENLLGEKENILKQHKEAQFESELISLFPSGRDQKLTDRERLILIKNTLQIEEVDGKKIVKRGGEILRDAVTKSPLPIDKAINDYFAEKEWIAAGGNGGRGGSDTQRHGGTGSIKTFSQAQEAFLSQNPNANLVSPEFTAYLSSVAKEPDFNMDA